MSRIDFQEIVDHAMKDRSLQGLRPVVEKEILHYDILYALETDGFLNGLTFQGGTSLRLCYGASRFSEDLDFVGGQDFSAKRLARMSECIMDHIGKRYGMEITVKDPKAMKEDPLYYGVNTDRWQIAVTTSPGQRHIPKQKIKLEVANIEAYTSELLSPMRNYGLVPNGLCDILVPTETLDEIMADKIVSLVACENRVRNRDVWDLGWLKQRGAKLAPELIEKKVSDYQIGNYEELLGRRIQDIRSIVTGAPFLDEMTRFIARPAQKTSIEKPGFLPFLAGQVGGLLTETNRLVYEVKRNPEPEFEFSM